MRIRGFALVALLTASMEGLATPPPPIPDTSCTATLCFQLSPTPAAISSMHTPDSGRVTTIFHFQPGTVMAVTSRPASSIGPALAEKYEDFRWHQTSATVAIASACLNCGSATPWEPQWIGIAVLAESPEELHTYLGTATVLLRAIELKGFYAQSSPALRVSELTSVFRENRKSGEWSR